ncbi:hypothetical protein [Paenibacillus aquistagni]|uniref:hypothetical protein n=1 Tax=Paenibacillus aquistagni TaxID=1852522 RepID=UPI000B5104AC|nr:hypothetical protein [Paenibacillus aquistagni]
MDDTSVRIKQELRSMNERLKKLDPVLSITKDSVQDLTSQLAKTSQQLSSSLKSALGGSQGSGQAAAISGLAGLESAVLSLSAQVSNLSRGPGFTADELASKIAKAISDEKDKDLPQWAKDFKDKGWYKSIAAVADVAAPIIGLVGGVVTGIDLTKKGTELWKNRKTKKSDKSSGGDSSKDSPSSDSPDGKETKSGTSDSKKENEKSSSSKKTETTGGRQEEANKRSHDRSETQRKPGDSVSQPKKEEKKDTNTKTHNQTNAQKQNTSNKTAQQSPAVKPSQSVNELTQAAKPPKTVKSSGSIKRNRFAGGKKGLISLVGFGALSAASFFGGSNKAEAQAESQEEAEQQAEEQYTNPVAQAAQTAINTVQTGRDLAATASTASSALSWTKKILTGAKVVNKVSRFARFTPMGLIGGFALDAGIYAAEKWLLPKLEKNTKKEEELTEEQIRKNAEQMRAFKEAANQAASTSNPGFQHTIPPTFGTLPTSSNVPTPSPATTPAQGQNTTDASPEPSAPRPQPHPGMLATPPAATFSTKPYTSMGTPMEPVSAPPAANSNASARTIPQTVDVNANSQVVMNLNVNGYIDRKMIEEIKRICREQYESAFRSFERGITSKVPLPPPVSKGGMMSY